MKNLLFYLQKYLSYIPRAFIAMMFLSHGIRALILNQHFVSIAAIMIGSSIFTSFAVFVVGIIDVAVAILVMIKRCDGRVLLYASLWPIVPSLLQYINNGRELFEFLPIMIMAALAYLIDFKWKVKE